MTTLWKRFRHWYRFGRHVNALVRQHFVVTSLVEHLTLVGTVREFAWWTRHSGSLNDGVPRHTRKRVAQFAERVASALPTEQDGATRV